MNVNEYGVIFYFSTGFDMSSQTSLRLDFTKPDGSTLAKTSGVTAPASPVSTTLGTFAASKYGKYTFINGDVDQAGTWTCRLTYGDAAGQHLISDVGTFTIGT